VPLVGDVRSGNRAVKSEMEEVEHYNIKRGFK
jgi:hypothetical protein